MRSKNTFTLVVAGVCLEVECRQWQVRCRHVSWDLSTLPISRRHTCTDSARHVGLVVLMRCADKREVVELSAGGACRAKSDWSLESMQVTRGNAIPAALRYMYMYQNSLFTCICNRSYKPEQIGEGVVGRTSRRVIAHREHVTKQECRQFAVGSSLEAV